MSHPRLNVATLGAGGHGKTTLTKALVARQAHRGFTCWEATGGTARHVFARNDNRTAVLLAHLTEYETQSRCYAHLDTHAPEDQQKALTVGFRHLHAAILVVAADEGVTVETHAQVRLAAAVGVPQIVVFLNKVDRMLEADLLDLAEVEIRTLLSEHCYHGDDVPIVRGSAAAVVRSDGRDPSTSRCIDDLLIALDESLQSAGSEGQGSFLMSVQAVFALPERDLLVTGQRLRGRCPIGEQVEIVGLRPSNGRAMIASQEIVLVNPISARDPNQLHLSLQGIARADVEPGMVLAAPGTIRAHTRFEAVAYFLTESEGGRRTAMHSGYRPQFAFHGTDIGGSITFTSPTEVVAPGDLATLTVEFYADLPVALEVGSRFTIREGSRTVGVGTVTRVLG